MNQFHDCWLLKVVLGGALEMYPAAITQKEKQLARLVSDFLLISYLPNM